MRDDSTAAGNVLLVSYAFPPLQVPMAPCAVKVASAIMAAGYHVDVVTIEPPAPLDSSAFADPSLLPYIEKLDHLDVTYLPKLRTKPLFFAGLPDYGWKIFLVKLVMLLERPFLFRLCASTRATWRTRILEWIKPDLTAYFGPALQRRMCAQIKRKHYKAVISLSPFHSINPVMVRIKKKFPHLAWVAQFGDPWAHNPLEHTKATNAWSVKMEPKTLGAADHIVFTSDAMLPFMQQYYGEDLTKKMSVIPYPFDPAIYPARPKTRNERIIIRHVGTLFEARTPEPLFRALGKLLQRKPGLGELFYVELIGNIEPQMLETEAAKALPEGLVKLRSSLPYVASLEAMYDADILLLIEAETAHTLFMPSKLSDYLGAATPILALVPQGPAMRALQAVGSPWCASPHDVEAISTMLEALITHVQTRASCAVEASIDPESFTLAHVGKAYATLIERLSCT